MTSRFMSIMVAGAIACVGVPIAWASAASAQDVGICSAAYARHSNKTQPDAKMFGRTCLAEQGAVAQTLTSAGLAARLSEAVAEDHDLVELSPSDVSVFCPAYPQLGRTERARFWQAMLGRIAVQESALKAAEPYWEFDQNQYSIGLLQLSLSDERGYRCGLTGEVDLTKPELNLRCGAHIMATLVRRFGWIGGDPGHTAQGAAAYWSTLRAVRRIAPGAPARDSRSLVIQTTLALPFCHGR